MEHPAFNLLKCISMLTSKLLNFQCVHCLREGNFCADYLARLAPQSGVGVQYFDQPPYGVLQLLDADCREFSRPRLCAGHVG